MKDTATRARDARLRKLRRDAMQLIFWLSVGFIAVLVTATAARADTVELVPVGIGSRTVLAQGDNSVLTWPAGITRLYHNPAGSPLAPDTAEAVLRYAAWSWSQRTGLIIDYMGTTTQAQIDGAIVVRWISALDMILSRGVFTRAYTSNRYYPHSNELVSSEIILKASDWSGSLYNARRDAQTLIHEMGHAIGINGHSDNVSAVMYPSQQSGRYALTVYDVRMAGYQQHICHAELTPHGDVYIPAIMGAGVTLTPVDGLFHISHEHHSGEICSGSFDGQRVTINEVRAFDATYHDAVLVQHNDGWMVE